MDPYTMTALICEFHRFITVIPMAPNTEAGNPKQNVYHYWPQVRLSDGLLLCIPVSLTFACRRISTK